MGWTSLQEDIEERRNSQCFMATPPVAAATTKGKSKEPKKRLPAHNQVVMPARTYSEGEMKAVLQELSATKYREYKHQQEMAILQARNASTRNEEEREKILAKQAYEKLKQEFLEQVNTSISAEIRYQNVKKLLDDSNCAHAAKVAELSATIVDLKSQLAGTKKRLQQCEDVKAWTKEVSGLKRL